MIRTALSVLWVGLKNVDKARHPLDRVQWPTAESRPLILPLTGKSTVAMLRELPAVDNRKPYLTTQFKRKVYV